MELGGRGGDRGTDGWAGASGEVPCLCGNSVGGAVGCRMKGPRKELLCLRI